jgi:hypothetical protein
MKKDNNQLNYICTNNPEITFKNIFDYSRGRADESIGEHVASCNACSDLASDNKKCIAAMIKAYMSLGEETKDKMIHKGRKAFKNYMAGDTNV